MVRAHGLYESGQFEAAGSLLKQLYQEKDQVMPIHQVAIDELYLATLLMEVVTGQVTLTDVQTSIEAILDNKAFSKRFKQPTASNYRIRALLKIVFDKDWDQARQALESGKDLIAQCGSTTDCRFEALAYRRIQDYLDK
ncbi:hypothetical protein ACYCEV_04315 [Aerococcus mictus]